MQRAVLDQPDPHAAADFVRSQRARRAMVRKLFAWIPVACLIALAAGADRVLAQDEAVITPPADTLSITERAFYENLYVGQFAPGHGFDVLRTKAGSLNISFYGLFRYLNQLPADQTFTDHLGRVRAVKTKNDLNWHRTFVWLTGFFFDPRFRYNISLWSLPTTQQTLLFGNLRYTFTEALTLGVGLGPNLTNRSLQGSWPFWAGSDRQMAEDFLRGGFSSSFFITGMPIDRFYYTASVNTNISQLGVTAANDTRDMAYSASWWWMPSTGEFGPRGGLGDLEHHERLATRFGMSGCRSRESRYAALDQAPNATQIRLSDGVFPFEAGALADGVTVERLLYENLSIDAGLKYRGFSLQGEYTFRRLSDFEATGPVPESSLNDQGFFVQAMQMVVPKKLGLYAVTSIIYDDFDRRPWELGGGANFYPYGSRSWRLNLHLLHVDKSPAGSNFGYYSAGQTGTILSLGTDILL
jgi:hypothetical protein